MPPWLYPSLLPAYAAALAFGYLCGSIPFGLILTRLAGTADIRTIGSGNIGATNVLRTGRKGLAAATLIGDALKGTLAVLLVYYYYGGEYRYFAHELALPAAAGAFLGHLFPVWLGFRGGKRVATYIGLLLALAWPGAIAFCLIWLPVPSRAGVSGLRRSLPARRRHSPCGSWAIGRRRCCLRYSPCCCGSCTAPTSRASSTAPRARSARLPARETWQQSSVPGYL